MKFYIEQPYRDLVKEVLQELKPNWHLHEIDRWHRYYEAKRLFRKKASGLPLSGHHIDRTSDLFSAAYVEKIKVEL